MCIYIYIHIIIHLYPAKSIYTSIYDRVSPHSMHIKAHNNGDMWIIKTKIKIDVH